MTQAQRERQAEHPLHRLGEAFDWLDDFVRAAVARAQAADHSPNEALRGLIITDAEIDAHLRRSPLSAPWSLNGEAPSPAHLLLDPASPLGALARRFDLDATDCAILLLAAAPEFDRRYERLYAYLQDDVSQKRPTVNLMMNLLGADAVARFDVRGRLLPDRPLRQHRLLEVAPESGGAITGFLAHHLRVDARIVGFLLGDPTPDARLNGAARHPQTDALTPVLIDSLPDDLHRVVGRALWDAALLHLRGSDGAGREALVAAVCAAHAVPLIVVDLERLLTLDLPLAQSWPLALREAALAEAALLLRGWDAVLDEGTGQPPRDLWTSLLEYPGAVMLLGGRAWEPLDHDRPRRLLRLSLELPAFPQRARLWEAALARLDEAERPKPHVTADDVAAIARKFRFTPAQIARAANTAADLAAARGEAITPADLLAGAAAHSSLKLGRLARQIAPRHTWDDLILPPDRLGQLAELRARAEHAHTVGELWGFRRKIAPRPGLSALFAGESGTGKTMAAEVIAGDLGLVLYRIDLSAVVSKYIGETEKNLASIFEEAHASNAILFFDEADALFGKRSEVKDAHDRYANIETAYLLQQIEDYDGIAVLATNLRQNLDEAFTRRLDFVIDFPFPEAEYRQRIWETHFPPSAPLARDVDFAALAERYPLAGGNIRNAALASAYLAAAEADGDSRGVIAMRHIRAAIRREHQKMGRLAD